MERSTMFKFGKPSISMGHGFHGYVSHNQMVFTVFHDVTNKKPCLVQDLPSTEMNSAWW